MAETPMSNEVRRTLAHLGTPRNVEDLTDRLLVDPGAAAVDVGGCLDEALSNGWVASLGSHEDADSVLAAVEADQEAIDLHPEQAEIWANRAEAGRRRSDGELYILSKEGLSALQGPDDEEDEGE